MRAHDRRTHDNPTDQVQHLEIAVPISSPNLDHMMCLKHVANAREHKMDIV